MKLSLIKNLALIFILFLGCSNAIASENLSFQIANSQIITIDSKVLDRKYDLFIKVPIDYAKEENKYKRYPVLYLNDGPHTFKVASGVTHFSQMDKVIVVGVSFAHGENGQYSRVRDLTPVVDESWTKYKTGGAPNYLNFFEKEVITYIEENYRTNPNQRILSGHSLGGSFGAWVLLTKPELFSSYILTSPSLWFKKHWIFDLEDKFHLNNKSLKANLFFATGSLETIGDGMYYEMVDDQIKFVQQLLSRDYQGLNIQEEIVNGTDHYSTFPVGLSKGLMFTYKQMKLL
ncbi:alpha/beta hydrolase [Arenicella xantha]|uniref:Alpha/beta superfamily hydrolase n=1 Tax=Arenicella xantha TaxID=644221 RepID=A0A395JFL9_9GAMM|nr:alpha/beta hydrolase-fold protein [Arenicella xantha]RBP48550.1 hypothetical protein DFR28_10636 [Arenicella xantha]